MLKLEGEENTFHLEGAFPVKYFIDCGDFCS